MILKFKLQYPLFETVKKTYGVRNGSLASALISKNEYFVAFFVILIVHLISR